MESRDHIERCIKCNGSGCTPFKHISIYEICQGCNGTGEADWVDNMMGKRSTNPMCGGTATRLAMKNARILMEEIKRNFHLIGISVLVSIEEIPEYYRYSNYIQPSRNHQIKYEKRKMASL